MKSQKFKTFNEARLGSVKFFGFMLICNLIYLIYSFFKTIIFTDIKLLDENFIDKWFISDLIAPIILICFVFNFIPFLRDYIPYKLFINFKNKIIENGIKTEGKIIDVKKDHYYIRINSTRSVYIYFVKLKNEKIVKTQIYSDNFFDELEEKKCTVYEYNGKYIFEDFR